MNFVVHICTTWITDLTILSSLIFYRCRELSFIHLIFLLNKVSNIPFCSYIHKNTQPHTLWCKIEYKPYKALNISVDCGAGGKWTLLYKLFKYNRLPSFKNYGVRFGKFRSRCNLVCYVYLLSACNSGSKLIHFFLICNYIVNQSHTWGARCKAYI